MSGEFSTEELDYYAMEDQAIERVQEELANEPWNVPQEEINQILERLRLAATVAIQGNGYRIVRTPENTFEIQADRSAHNEDLRHAA